MLKQRWQPFIDDMNRQTGLNVKAFFATDYSGIIEAMRFNKVQIGYFGNASAMGAVDRSNGEIFAKVLYANGDTGYKSVSWQEANEDLISTFIIRNIIMYTVVGAILLVASFGTYNIISTITHEKARDIAIMKSLGLPEFTVRSIFVVEALMIGIAGALAGFAFGYVLCLGLGSIRITNPFIDSDRLPLVYEPLHYLLAGAVALVSSVIAGYQPARKAARQHPVEIIRGAT